MSTFDDETRAVLFEEGILSVDEYGQDVFTGLTFAETCFMLNYELPASALRDGEARLFQQLHAKFMAARGAARYGTTKIAVLQLERHRLIPDRDI